MRCCLALLAVLFAFSMAPAHAEKRIALVIGNGAYQNTTQIKSTKDDAADMAAVLKRLGFDVVDGTDLDKRAMERTMREFTKKLDHVDVALFYFAGHGLQSGGQNYLMPIDARLRSEGDIDFEAIPLSLVLRQMEREAKTSIVLLDACRDNPLARTLARTMGSRSSLIGKGLAEVKGGVGTLVGLATQPDNIALEGNGRNSPYTAALLKHMEEPGRELSTVLVAVRNDVLQATSGKQVPWEFTSLTDEIYFKPPRTAQPGPAPAPALVPSPAPSVALPPPPFTTGALPTDYDKEMEIAFWNAVKGSKSPAVLQTYLDRFPNGTFSGLALVMIEIARKEEAAARPPSATPPARVTSLPGGVQAPSPATAPATNPQGLARALQAELKRVGCDPGSVDGNWGDKSRQALDRFARLSKLQVPGGNPSEPALQAVAGQKGRICPPECAKGEVERDGTCVAKAPAQKRKTVTRQRPKTETETYSPGFRVCIGGRALGLCTN